jgi:hypothetical protein
MAVSFLNVNWNGSDVKEPQAKPARHVTPIKPTMEDAKTIKR